MEFQGRKKEWVRLLKAEQVKLTLGVRVVRLFKIVSRSGTQAIFCNSKKEITCNIKRKFCVVA